MLPIELYTTSICPYCLAAKDLLRRKNVAFTEINVMGDPARRKEMVERASGRTTVPQIFVGKTHVGGCDDLYELEHEGKLDALLANGAAA
jgi:glutaredoxin 3